MNKIVNDDEMKKLEDEQTKKHERNRQHKWATDMEEVNVEAIKKHKKQINRQQTSQK